MSKTKETSVNLTKKERRIPEKAMPLLVFACVLSVASLGWTTYSLLDLLKVGAIGLTVAATADLIWSAVIWCEYQDIGPKWWVKAVGWLTVLVVGGFISWHGVSQDSMAMAVAGPFLTLGTKAVWELTLVALKDPVREKKEAARKQIALLDAETDTIMGTTNAQIRKENAESEADHSRLLAEKRRDHELRMAELTYEAEEKRVAAEHRSDMLVNSIESKQFERLMGIIERRDAQQTISGQVVPQVQPGSAPQALAGSPSQTAVNRPGMLTVSIAKGEEPMTEAQEARKRLAALYYLSAAEAENEGMHLSMTAFAATKGTNKVMVSRCCKEFPLEQIKDDIEAYRQDMGKTG